MLFRSWTTESEDVWTLNLPKNQDAAIAAVAKANAKTVVVLETGGPVVMPWLKDVGAVLQAWYPGTSGGEAIARVLTGEVDASGRLPVTFPVSEAQLPRPKLDGDPKTPEALFDVDYTIEGADVGYRWFARQGLKPLFPFGYGLSYSTFASSDLKVSGLNASFRLSNTGSRAGATVGQVYLVSANGQKRQRLVGFRRVELAPGGSQTVTLSIDPRLLATLAFLGYALVLWLRSEFNSDADVGTILLPTVLQGVATAFYFIPLQAIIYARLPMGRLPAAGSTAATAPSTPAIRVSAFSTSPSSCS